MALLFGCRELEPFLGYSKPYLLFERTDRRFLVCFGVLPVLLDVVVHGPRLRRPSSFGSNGRLRRHFDVAPIAIKDRAKLVGHCPEPDSLS